MYVGRIVAIGATQSGRVAAMYRVSSRSFPNRQAKVLPGAVAVVPKPGFENDIQKNPYIAYNCLRLVGNVAVATNGSHTDPIAEKIASGMNLRDALATVLLALDYEHDQLSTPRIAALVQAGSDRAWLGIVRPDALFVREFRLQPGTAYYVCTYEHNEPLPERVDTAFDVASADEACQYVLGKGAFAALERPVTAACALASPNGFETAIADAQP
ncbi:MAG: IMP cyclohydrolase [Lentisphaerae bacterium RIFOXYB12_FULL_65_16]|nr:MAG: IMP cyclohydrolase [Lentisphaerae bacterium RIFOXYA12_64_32]OGV91576.1 MAG: IMP cyclohydrolase [Lentisphaerae bacterium RIFOXYB12_FULL_65_16]